MSSTIIFPIIYATSRNDDGELILHPSVKFQTVITENYGLAIEIKSNLYFIKRDGLNVEIEFAKSDRALEYNDVVIFTGFYSTALNIIEELGIPDHQVEWVN